jgi:hypothetical protein
MVWVSVMVPEQSKTLVPPAATAASRLASVQDVIVADPLVGTIVPGPECFGTEAAAAVDVPSENARSAAGARPRSRTDGRLEPREPPWKRIAAVVAGLTEPHSSRYGTDRVPPRIYNGSHRPTGDA